MNHCPTFCDSAPLNIRRHRQTGEISRLEIQPSKTKSETVRSRRPREHLTEAEIERLMTVARHDCRYGHLDATAMLIAYRHGLRSNELVDLQWDQIDFVQKTIRINRVKNGTGSTHYLGNSELRVLRRLQRETETVEATWFLARHHRLFQKPRHHRAHRASLRATSGHDSVDPLLERRRAAPSLSCPGMDTFG
jgi:integrase